jgi:hypothetical protein
MSTAGSGETGEQDGIVHQPARRRFPVKIFFLFLFLNAAQRMPIEAEGLIEKEIESFVRATGGGRGKYEADPKYGKQESSKHSTQYFQQDDKSKKPEGSPGLGYGRIKFLRSSGDPKPYIRVPWNSKKECNALSTNPQLLLHFVETVWGLPRPKLLVSVTGGAMNFPVSDDLELVLSDLMHFSRRTNAWLTTGGTYAGIMKLLG